MEKLKSLNVLFLTNIPSPYRVDFFNEFGKYCSLTVTFEGKKATDRDEKWQADNVYNFKAVYLKGIRVSNDKFLCFDIIKVLNKKWDAIIIGGYSTPTSILAIEYLKLKKQKFFIEADGGFIGNDNWIKYKIKKHLISAASWWLSSGKETTKYLTYYGAKQENCYLFPFTSLKEADLKKAVELKEYDKNEIKQRLNINEGKILLAIGQFIPRKGFDILIEAIKILPNNVGVYIIGGKPPEEYKKLKTLYQLNNLHFVGFKRKTELAYYYAMADVFVLPTREDIWGLVVNEAMAFGLPIITTDKCIAGLELVDDKNGVIIPVNNVYALSNAINYILNNDTEKMGRVSIDRIKQYTIEKMAKIHSKILKIVNFKEFE